MAAPSLVDPPSSQNRDTGKPSQRHPYAQIVRSGDATASSNKKSPQIVNPGQIPSTAKPPDAKQVRNLRQSDAELCRVPSESTLDVKGIAADCRASDGTKGEEGSEASKTVAEGPESDTSNAVTADASAAVQSKAPEGGDVMEPRVSRPPWRKPPTITEGEAKPQPVMGATAWPALAEARNMKTSETRKGKAATLLPARDASKQESLTKPGQSGESSIQQQGMKHRPPFKGGAAGVGRPAFQPIENGASTVDHPTLVPHRGSEPPTKHNAQTRMKANYPGNQHLDNDRVLHHRNDGGAPFFNSNRKWRNSHRDHGRGNFGWQHHGRAYENAGDMFALLHEQRIGPRNMPRPQPFMNMNPGFYSLPHFQNGGMYYIPPGAPEFVHGPYFPPMGPAGGMMHGPDTLSLRSMLLKQIDYYFSVENLCRDVFLRTHMDEEGFVPVSVIAQFNRVRSLSPNPMVILEALQQSAVVEVQHDKIRRRNDRGKWRLLPGQVYAVNPVQESISTGNLTERGHGKPEQAIENGSVSFQVETNNGPVKVVDMPLADVEHGQHKSDRLNCSDDCLGLGGNSRQLGDDDGNSANPQHYVLSGPGAATVSTLYRGVSANKAANGSSIAGDLSGCLNPKLNFVQNGTEHADVDAMAQKDNCSCSSRASEENGTISQTIADGKPGYWKAPEGFRMADDAYGLPSSFQQDITQLHKSDFVLNALEDGDEHQSEANDRDIQRLIAVPPAHLGSFIAVP